MRKTFRRADRERDVTADDLLAHPVSGDGVRIPVLPPIGQQSPRKVSPFAQPAALAGVASRAGEVFPERRGNVKKQKP